MRLRWVGCLAVVLALSAPSWPVPQVERDGERVRIMTPAGEQSVSQLDGGRTGTYRDAAQDLSRGRTVRTALLLGLGGGEMLRAIRREHPKATLVGVEIDERVAHIAYSAFGIDQLGDVTVVVADAARYVRNERRDTFDIVMVDLFNDAQLAPCVFDPVFWEHVLRISKRDALIIFNAGFAVSVPALKAVAPTLRSFRQVQYGGNVLLVR